MLMLKTCLKLTNYRAAKHLCTIEHNDFKPIYKFPYVRGVGLINRLKLYQTTLSAVAVPIAGILNQLNLFSHDDLIFTTMMSLGGLVPLYGFGYFANKLVGIVYLDTKKNVAKVAYLDFWGRRKDVVIPVEDIIPLSETPRSLTDPLYVKVKQYSSPNTMKLCSTYGVLDQSGFNKVFLH